MPKLSGKKEFYPKAEEALEAAGYQYFDGDRDIRGKTRSHASKPDYIAIGKGALVIGEIKSPNESPKSGCWRTPQKSDTESFIQVRNDVAKRERDGSVSKEIGGHEIIILGQIPDYVRKLNVTYEIPLSSYGYKALRGGYTVPEYEGANVFEAFKNLQMDVLEVININNGAMSFIYVIKNMDL